jgi:hypothetical protein
VKEWLDLMRTGEVLLLAGIRRQIGPERDLRSEYRNWYKSQMREHDELLAESCARLEAANLQSEDGA